MNNSQYLKLFPHLDLKPWAGKKLESLYSSEQKSVGEAFLVSVLKGQESKTSIGEDLQTDISYLVKLIDTSKELSIQVHPGDEYARKNENSSGKKECWIILSANHGSGIYLGLKNSVNKKDFENALQNGEEMDQYLQFHEAKKGQFFFVPEGSIHAIGKGITLLEVQQSSGITYRVWDWNRLGDDGRPRDLHIEKALDVINFEIEKNKKEFFQYQSNIFEEKSNLIISERDFKMSVMYMEKENLKLTLSEKSSLIPIDHKMILNKNDELNAFHSLIALCDQEIEIEMAKGSYFILVEAP